MAAYVSNAGKTWVEKGKREKKMRRRPMKLKHLPTRWNFLYSLCMATTLTDPASSSSCPLHADWNPINAADGGETKIKKNEKTKKRRKRRKNLQSFQLIFHPFPCTLPLPVCGWAELLLRCCQAACSAFDEQTTWKKGKCWRGRGLARCEAARVWERARKKSFFKMPNALRR